VAWERARRGLGSAHVVARESAHVEARGAARRGLGSAHVVARESAHVEAWGSAHVEATGAAFVRAFQTSQVTVKPAAAVIVMRHATTTQVAGGTIIDVPPVTTAAAWCDYYGVDVTDGIATVFKGVDDHFNSPHGANYAPGTVPIAADWDGGRAECGGGFHFSPRPASTKDFNSAATKFLACRVRLKDMRAPRADDCYPSKIKAKGCCAPCVEVTLWGEPARRPRRRCRSVMPAIPKPLPRRVDKVLKQRQQQSKVDRTKTHVRQFHNYRCCVCLRRTMVVHEHLPRSLRGLVSLENSFLACDHLDGGVFSCSSGRIIAFNTGSASRDPRDFDATKPSFEMLTDVMTIVFADRRRLLRSHRGDPS
jgi:hypothetical protein